MNGFTRKCIRFIPVYTGNIPKSMLLITSFSGLSLCIQGTSSEIENRIISDRFIPVYTGNITNNVACVYRQAVYPCVYREHDSVYNEQADKNGLSLCIQGTSPAAPRVPVSVRFIPVYTGNI